MRWYVLHRKHPLQLLQALAKDRHPELRTPVVWDDFVRMAEREGVAVRVVDLPRPQKGRLVRLGQHAFIQLSLAMTRDERTVFGLHELCHFWRDDPGVACYYADESAKSSEEEFADVFAWLATSPAREFLRGARAADF